MKLKKFRLPDVILGILFSVPYSYLVFFYLVNFFGVEHRAGIIIALIFLAFYLPMTIARAINLPVILANIVLGLILTFNSVNILQIFIIMAIFSTIFLYVLQRLHFSLESKILQMPRLVLSFHLVQFFVIFSALILSLWLVPLRVYVAIAGVSGLFMWNQKFMDGCPMTWLEDHLLRKEGEKTELKKAGSLSYYTKVCLGINIPDSAFTKISYLLGVAVAGWWIIDFLI